MKIFGIVFMLAGLVFFVPAVIGLVTALQGHGLVEMSMMPMWISFIFAGVVFAGAGWWVMRLGGATGDIPNGVPATALITSVQDSGVTINDTSLMVNLGLKVTVDGAPPYDATAKVMLQGRTQWGALQPGMTVPVKVDPANPQRVSVVLDAAVSAAAAPPELIAQAVNTVLGAGGAAAGRQAGMITMKAADIIREGVKTSGTLVSVTPTGLTAAQAAGGLAPAEADDPLVVLVFTFEGEGGQQHTNKGVVRVPDGKAGFLARGAAVPVAYLAGRPDTATIDWPLLV